MVGILIAVGIVIIICVTSYELNTNRDNLKLTFKQFKSFYDVNPEAWCLDMECSNRVSRQVEAGKDRWGDPRYKELYFRFNFIDWIRYRIWSHSKKDDNEKVEYVKDMTLLTKEIHKDIARKNELARKQEEEARRNLERILEMEERSNPKVNQRTEGGH